MTTPAIDARLTQKIIAVLSAVSDVTKYTSTRIYGSHISTIQDKVYPAISLYLADGNADNAEIMGETVYIQIDLWFNAIGKNAYVWDDVMECYQAMKEALHRVNISDSTIGIKVLESTMLSKGPQISDEDGKVLHYPTRWKFRARI